MKTTAMLAVIGLVAAFVIVAPLASSALDAFHKVNVALSDIAVKH